MKILIASDTFYPHINGCSYFTQRLAEGLSERGHEVAVISPGPEFASTIRPYGKVTHYGVRSLPILIVPNFRFVLPVISGISGQVSRAIREFAPDVVHIQMHFPISRTALRHARAAGIPVVATNHFMPENVTHYLHLPLQITEAIHSLAWRDAARIYRKTYGVTAPTRTAGRMLEPWLRAPVATISNGINLVRFNPRNDPEPARGEYRLPDKPILLSVGRLDKEKNVDVILRALAQTKDTVDIHFAIAGHGAESAKLKKLAKELDIENRVTFLGFVPDELLPSLYAAADCFVSAGIAELQCLVVMEAMATGLPILGARAVALPELIHHGENGFLFEPGASKELAEELVQVFSNPTLRERMSQKSLEIISRHDLNTTLAAFEELYRKAIEEAAA